MITRDEWLSALKDVGSVEPTDNHDALTTREFGALFGLKSTASKARLRLLIDAGRAVAVTKRETDAMGRPVSVPAYILQKPKAKK